MASRFMERDLQNKSSNTKLFFIMQIFNIKYTTNLTDEELQFFCNTNTKNDVYKFIQYRWLAKQVICLDFTLLNFILNVLYI